MGTLHVKPDNTYAVYFDMEEKASGSLHDDWAFPKKQIDDPSDKKPSDWVDIKEIPDPEDVKPEGYDDVPEKIADPEAEKPDDWDDEDDGEWEPPTIDNPDYKGPWKQKMIPNPEFTEDIANYGDIGAVGFELWVVNSGTIFDNILVTDSLDEAFEYAEKTFKVTKDAEKTMKDELDRTRMLRRLQRRLPLRRPRRQTSRTMRKRQKRSSK